MRLIILCRDDPRYYDYLLGLDGRAVPSSEFVWYAPGPASVASSILISLSRSGKTSESVEAIRKAVKAKISTIAVTSDPTSTMSKECDFSEVKKQTRLILLVLKCVTNLHHRIR